VRFLALLLLAGCAADGRTTFEADVVPILERSCAGSTCHGVAPGAEEAGEHIDRDRWFLDLDAQGRISDVDAAWAASLARVDAADTPLASSLVRKPLTDHLGGLPHGGGDNFLSVDDADLQTILEWIELEEAGGEDPEPLDAHEEAFAADVQPLLFDLGCASGGCHGLQASIPFRLDPGVAGAVGASTTRHNADVAASMLSHYGDPVLGRLLRKMLPLHAGGVVHKGGNDRFLSGPQDRRMGAVLDWACGLRPCDDGAIDGLVFRRGPAAPDDPLDVDVFEPGSDLWYAPWEADALGPAVNLTATLHSADADVRDPALDASGRWLLFSMRQEGELGHSLWRLDLDTGEPTQLTPAPETTYADRDPAYASDGSIWFVSSRAGTLAGDGSRIDADLYRIDPTSGDVTRRSWTPQIERTPRYLATGHENGGEIAFTALRDAVPDAAVAHPFRFPPDLSSEYHQHFGVTGPSDLLFDMQELPDGRYVQVSGALSNVWPLGDLAVLDRNFGPALDPTDPTPVALPLYAPPLVELDPRAQREGTTWTVWGDPAPLPDGRIVAAFAEGPFDLDDPDADIHTALTVVELREDPATGGPVLDAQWTLLEDADASLSEPVPVVRRFAGPPAGAPPETTDPGRALFVHQGLPFIDGILGALPPAGVRAVDHEFASVRLIEALPATPSQRAPILGPKGAPAGTTTGLSPHSPARVLAELPLEPDGSFQVDLPAGISVRVQGLDEDGFARGTPHNRWFDFTEGQTIKQGLPSTGGDVYGTRCAGCHGAADGVPENTFTPPDAISMATFTLARFEGRNPRRPKEPVVVGDGTAWTVDFETDISPILTGCAACHDGADSLDLRPEETDAFTVAYESLLRPTDPLVDTARGSAWHSRLMEVVTGRELGADGAPLDGPHPPSAPLSDEDIGALIRWIDLGSAWSTP
jgi:hypothetical protein